MIFLLSYHGASVYLHILEDREFFVEEYDRLLLSQPVIFLLSYHGASVYLLSVIGLCSVSLMSNKPPL